MKASEAKPRIPIRLNRQSDAPIYRQIYARIRGAILTGTLPPGARLPSWNALASQLGVARGTVKAAYECLAGEGYIWGEGAAGTRVNAGLGGAAPMHAAAESAQLHRHLMTPPPVEQRFAPRSTAPRPFQVGVPALDAFPRGLWTRLAARQARGLVPARMVYPEPEGYAPLRESIARYVAVARGVVCAPEQIFITGGYAGALDLIARTLLARRDAVWIEDPAYYRAREALEIAGARLVPVTVDADGMIVDRGVSASPAARLAVVTPSHQAPLGMPLSLSRRLALLSWAEWQGTWIVEDDYYGEFHFRGPPVPALKSLDRADRVLYVGTFSKVLMPSLRLGYIVAPGALAPRLSRVAAYLTPSQSLIAQMSVAAFMAEGHFARHIRRMRRLYAERRAALVVALDESFGTAWEIDLRESGMHLLARLPAGADDVALAAKAAAAGLGVAALSPWAIKARCGPGLILGFANTPATRAAQDAARLADVVPQAHRRRRIDG